MIAEFPTMPVPQSLLTQLEITLWVKIVFTLLLWAIPPLLASRKWFGLASIPAPVPLVFVKVMAVAFLALVVSYASGLLEAYAGRVSLTTVIVGIISNGGAFLTIAFFRLCTDEFNSFGLLGRLLFDFSAVVLLAITASLIVVFVATDGLRLILTASTMLQAMSTS